jgi:hypothetical protein
VRAGRVRCRNWATPAAQDAYVLAPVDLHPVQAAAAIVASAARSDASGVTIAASAVPVAAAVSSASALSHVLASGSLLSPSGLL